MSRSRTLRAPDLPALTAFARAYLHEDVIAEYGTAAGAAAAFARDADEEERRLLADDLERLASVARRWPAARLTRFFVIELASAWAPASLAELDGLMSSVRRDAE
jgi:hypothetical protein